MKSLIVLFACWCGALIIASGCNKSETTTTTNSSDSSQHSTTSTPGQSTTTTTDTSHAATTTATTAITGKALDGQKIYYNTAYGKIKVACAGCHTDGQPTTQDTRLRPGHTLVGITSRTSTWNGQFTGATLQPNAYGATACAVMYQHKGKDVASVMPQADIDALNAYYDAIKSAPGAMTSNLKIQWVTKPAMHDGDPIDDKAANAAAKDIMKLPADPTAGKDVFSRTCTYCHGLKEKKNAPALSDAMKQPIQGARSVRCGSNAMPFYAKDLLTDQQIADVIAYIQTQIGK